MTNESTFYSEIDEFVARFIRLNEDEKAFFHSLLSPKSLKRKDFFLQEGELCPNEAFVVKGCLRTFFTGEDGQEMNLRFSTEGWWIGDLVGQVEKTVSKTSVEALENCELLVLSADSKEVLFERVPKFERMFRLLTERALVFWQNRLIRNVTMTADERYLTFIEQYPAIEQRVAQYHIASYLGITPEFLSKVRARLSGHRGH
jgi:CRP-like cAMP-binding protein